MLIPAKLRLAFLRCCHPSVGRRLTQIPFNNLVLNVESIYMIGPDCGETKQVVIALEDCPRIGRNQKILLRALH